MSGLSKVTQWSVTERRLALGHLTSRRVPYCFTPEGKGYVVAKSTGPGVTQTWVQVPALPSSKGMSLGGFTYHLQASVSPSVKWRSCGSLEHVCTGS